MGFLLALETPLLAAEIGGEFAAAAGLAETGALASVAPGVLVGGAEAFVPTASGGFFDSVGGGVETAFGKFGAKFADDPIGSGLSTFGALAALGGGVQGKNAAEFEAAQFREEMEIARIAGEQEEVQRRRRLNETLAAQRAIRAGRGVELFGSGSFEAFRSRTIMEAEEDITTAKLNAFNRSRRFGLSASEAEARGNAALLGGVGSAATALARGTRT